MLDQHEFKPKQVVNSANENQSGAFFLALLIFLMAANLFTINFISRENYLYFWDYSNYWEKVVRISDQIVTEPYSTIRSLIYSVREDDWNLFPAFLLMPVTFFFGSSRLAYILSIVNIFAFAAVGSFAFLHIRLSKLAGYSSPILPLISVGVVLLSPNFWNALLYGYLDVGGVAIINLILLLYLQSSSSKNSSFNSWLISLLIPIAILFRRYYVYWGVTFYIASVVEQCYSLFRERPFRLNDYVKILFRLGLQASISALFLIAVAPTFTVRSLTTNYADIYSPYRFHNSLLESFSQVFHGFGLLAFSIFIVGAVQSIFDKTTRHFSIFLLVQWLVIFYLYSKTQDFGPHHFYLLLPAMLLFSALFITRLFMRYGVVVWSGVILLLIMNFLSAFSSQELWYRKPLAWILTDIRHPPLVRGDVGEIDRMLAVLTETLTDPGDRVYVLASSNIVNWSILRNARLSLNRHAEISKRILATNDWDKRDGFPQRLLTTKYVIVANPIQYHARPSEQRVVGIPAQLILDGKNIGKSFIKLPYQFNLDGGVKAYLYKKMTSFDDSDLGALSQMFKNYYPDRPNIYQIAKN
jgi:hypothetical protein